MLLLIAPMVPKHHTNNKKGHCCVVRPSLTELMQSITRVFWSIKYTNWSIDQCKSIVNKKKQVNITKCKYVCIKLVHACWENWQYEKKKKNFFGLQVLEAQLPGRLFSPSDISKKLSHHFLLHFPIGMGSYDHHTKYQGVFP